jgi:pimeloyl-ACP methyl ester carboxylesterase
MNQELSPEAARTAAHPMLLAPRPTGPGSFAPRRIVRALRGRLGRIAGGLITLLLLGLLAARHESALEAADARAYTPPGQMVGVGGHRLHLSCVGTGSPTVVLDAGMGGWSASWSRVQPEAAKYTRVCTYDRAGMGFSEDGPAPRTARRFAGELHTLLHEAGELGPYVLVGHSLGGLTVRVFAQEYASETAGVVLVDSMHPGSAAPAAAATPGATPAATLGASTTLAESGLLSAGRWALTLPARVGLLRLFAGPLDLAAGLSPEVADPYTAISVTPRPQLATLDEFLGTAESLAQAAAVTSLGDMPLIVLSRGVPGADEQKWQRAQTELLHLSSNSRQVVAEQSGHNVPSDQPGAAVGAIAQMVELVRGRAAR